MIRHIVMWKLHEEAEGASKSDNAKKIKQLLDKLVGSVPEIKSLKVGIDNDSPFSNYDVVLDTTFESMEDLGNYQQHPEHKAAGAFIKSVVAERSCVDFED